MSIGAISPVSVVGPVESAMDGPLHLREPGGDQTGRHGGRQPRDHDPEHPPRREGAGKHDVDQLA